MDELATGLVAGNSVERLRRHPAFSERPKHLDPARSYSSNEYSFMAQIYEPPLQYHFLKRPYALVPLSAVEVPVPTWFDAAGEPLLADAPAQRIAYSEYVIRIRPGVLYQPHLAFARDAAGQPRYLAGPRGRGPGRDRPPVRLPAPGHPGADGGGFRLSD